MANTPNIRFKGFTDDWEQHELCDIYGKIRNAFVGTASPYYVENGHFYLESNNVKDGHINHNNEVFINDEFYEKQRDNWLHTGDIVMVQSGHVGHSAVIPEELNNTAAHALIIISNPQTEIDPYFLNAEFQTPLKKKNIDIITKGNTIKHILASDMKEFEVSLPNIREQRDISAFFRILDKILIIHQRRLEDLKNFKKVMLQKMFPSDGESIPEIRFFGFSDAWEQRKLGDCFSPLQNNTLSRADLSDENGVVMNVHYGDVLIKFEECLDVSKERLPFVKKQSVADKFATSYLKNGDVIVADTAEDETVGKCTEIIGLTDQKVISGLHTIPLRPNEQFATGYLGFYLNSAAYHTQLKPLMQGIKVTSISKSAMQDTVIKYPSDVKEQALIGQYFMNLDLLITLHQHKYENLLKMKKYLLQQMFC